MDEPICRTCAHYQQPPKPFAEWACIKLMPRPGAECPSYLREVGVEVW